MAEHPGLRSVTAGEGEDAPVLTCHERARQWLERAEEEMAGNPPRLGYVDVLAHIAQAWATLSLTEPIPLAETPNAGTLGEWLDDQVERPDGEA